LRLFLNNCVEKNEAPTVKPAKGDVWGCERGIAEVCGQNGFKAEPKKEPQKEDKGFL